MYYDFPYACSHNCSIPDARTMQALKYKLPIVSTSLQNAPGLPIGCDQRPTKECAPTFYNNSVDRLKRWGMTVQWTSPEAHKHQSFHSVPEPESKS